MNPFFSNFAHITKPGVLTLPFQPNTECPEQEQRTPSPIELPFSRNAECLAQKRQTKRLLGNELTIEVVRVRRFSHFGPIQE